MGTTALRHQWERHPNPEVRTLHLSVEVPRYVGASPDLGCEAGRRLHDDLMAIDGVSGASLGVLCRYSIQVTKGRCFEWGVVQARVLSVVEAFFGTAASAGGEG